MEIREQLRRDHAKALAELEAITSEPDGRRAQTRLACLRHAWMLHELAEESVVYRVLEGGAAAAGAEERFVEHELVEGLFARLASGRAGTLGWQARTKVMRGLVTRHIELEERELFVELGRRFPAEELCEMGRRFVLARDKLALLEAVKKAA